MPDQMTLTYPGNVVDDLVAMGEANHLFGPDLCGVAPAWEDVVNAFRSGAFKIGVSAAQARILPRGAMWELVAAEHDEARDVTIAAFNPYVDPIKRLRYVGGNAEHEPLGRRHLAEHDDIDKRRR